MTALGSTIFSVHAFAEGKIVIQPKIEAGYRNDSNFWKAENNEVSVNTYTAKPGLVFGYETAKSKIDLDATVDFYSYDDVDTPPPGVKDASDDNYTGFTGILAGETKPTDRLTLGLEDSLFKTRDIAQSDPLSNSVSREEFTINRLTPNLYYDFDNKFAIRSKYRNTNTNYKDAGEDSNEHRGIFDFEYNLDRSSTVFVEYQIWNRAYDLTSSDYTSNQATLNFAKQFNYFGILAGAGYHKRTFDNDTLDDMDLFSWNVVLRGQNPQAPEKKPRSHVALTLKQDMNDAGTDNKYYTATVAGIEAGYRFIHKIDTSLNFTYQNSDYKESLDDRSDDTWTTSGKVKYDMLDYLAFGLEAGFSKRDSNIAGLSYDNTFVGLTLDFNYNLGSR